MKKRRMTRRQFGLGAGGVIAASCGGTGALAAATDHASQGGGRPDQKFGVQTHYGQRAWQGRRAQALLAAAGLPIHRVRDELYWAALETAPGVYDWDYADAAISRMMAGGVEVILSFDFGNALYCKSAQSFPDTDRARAAYAAYVFAVLNRYARPGSGMYAGRIAAVEIWNEANGAFSGGHPPKEVAPLLVKLTQAAHARIRADADFNGIPILGCATVGVPYNFIKWCFELGIGPAIDGVVVHPYGDAEDIYKKVSFLKRELARFGYGGSIWATEFGNLKEPAALLRALACVSAAPIKRASYYLSQSDGSFSSGLIDAGGAITPVGRVWRAWAEQLGRAKFIARLDFQPKTWGLMFQAADGTIFSVLWSQWGVTTIDVKGDHQVHGADGEPVEATGRYRLTENPIVVAGSPLIREDLSGDRPLTDAYADYSLDRNFGGWRYLFLCGPGDVKEMEVSAADQVGDSWNVRGVAFANIHASGAHPGVSSGQPLAVVRRWTVPPNVERIRVLGEVRRGSGGDGVDVRVLHNKVVCVSDQLLLNSILTFDQVRDVRAGDVIDFETGPGKNVNIDYDNTDWRIAIYATEKELTEPQIR